MLILYEYAVLMLILYEYAVLMLILYEYAVLMLILCEYSVLTELGQTRLGHEINIYCLIMQVDIFTITFFNYLFFV